MTEIACLIIGIDGWEQYTYPLLASLMEHEPAARPVVIDNASDEPYPALNIEQHGQVVYRTPRLCYAAAINQAAQIAGPADWYIVLSNDVLCTGPFAWVLEQMPLNTIAGPHIARNQGWTYLEGWCVACPAGVWASLGGWDEGYRVSSWEDVDFSVTALEWGFHVAHVPELPFIHLDQKQRFTLIPDYWSSEAHNLRYFLDKHTREITEQWRA